MLTNEIVTELMPSHVRGVKNVLAAWPVPARVQAVLVTVSVGMYPSSLGSVYRDEAPTHRR